MLLGRLAVRPTKRQRPWFLLLASRVGEMQIRQVGNGKTSQQAHTVSPIGDEYAEAFEDAQATQEKTEEKDGYRLAAELIAAGRLA